jgi:hypothetical protein
MNRRKERAGYFAVQIDTHGGAAATIVAPPVVAQGGEP